MSSYSELIKNFERIRAYMREFYVYGFKSRDDYNGKSARSYDDERRRMESWLGEHMSFIRTAEGKNMFISIDSRVMKHNPFFKAWKAKSFTDGDITLHFILFDILHSSETELSLPEIMELIDEKYLSHFWDAQTFDESTVRKKLKEYCDEGIIVAVKSGRRMLYRRAEQTPLPDTEVLNFFSEASPCGVVGSFLLDKCDNTESCFTFKHHYITGAMDSGVMAELFEAMRKKCAVSVSNLNRKREEPRRIKIVPLRIFISVQNGRQHLLAYNYAAGSITSLRLDYLSGVKIEESVENFDELRAMLYEMQSKMWGVETRSNKSKERTERVEFTVRVDEGEEYIINRLEREKRIGRVEKTDKNHYRFFAEVYDSAELNPWIRTFICRITDMRYSNRTVENRLKDDLDAMYRMYGIETEGQK